MCERIAKDVIGSNCVNCTKYAYPISNQHKSKNSVIQLADMFSKFVASQRGAKLLCTTDGHIYSKKSVKREALSHSTWRCRERNSKCKATITATNADPPDISDILHSHNHLPVEGKADALHVYLVHLDQHRHL